MVKPAPPLISVSVGRQRSRGYVLCHVGVVGIVKQAEGNFVATVSVVR